MTDFNMELCPIFSKMSENDIPDFDLELLTDLVTQLLSATEVQGRYKCPHFDDLSSLF